MGRILGLVLAAVVAGCASVDGSSLVPNRSTRTEAEALMGQPAERIEQAGGERVLYYPRGRHTYAVAIGADDLVRRVEQVRTRENVARLAAGTSTTKDVRAVFGPPDRIARMERLGRDVYEYAYMGDGEFRVLWVQLSFDGVVREVIDSLDWSKYSQSGPMF